MKRRNPTPKQKEAIRARYANRCPGLPNLGITCGKPLLKNSDAVYDHIDQFVYTGSCNVEEYQPLCKGRGGCNDIKTNGIGGVKRATTAGSDANIRAKHRHLTGKNKLKRKRPIPQRVNAWPARGARKLRSRNTFNRGVKP